MPHRLVTEPLAALLPPSLPFRAAAAAPAAAAGSRFWEAMNATVAVTVGDIQSVSDKLSKRHRNKDADLRLAQLSTLANSG